MLITTILLSYVLSFVQTGLAQKTGSWSPIPENNGRESHQNHYLESFRENDGYFLAASPSQQRLNVVEPPRPQSGDDSFVIRPGSGTSKHRVRAQAPHKITIYKEPQPSDQEVAHSFKTVVHEPQNIESTNRFNPHKRRKTTIGYKRPEPVFRPHKPVYSNEPDPVFNQIRAEPLVQAPPPERHQFHPHSASGPTPGFKESLVEEDSVHQASTSYENYLTGDSAPAGETTTKKDHVYYEDIYPKRVPNKVHQEWLNRQRKEQELQKLREREHGRRWRRYRARQRARRRKDYQASGTASGYRQNQLLREQRARSQYNDPHESSLFRSLLGVRPNCLSEDTQFACTFTPNCWLSGGVPQQGCDSLLYSCCVLPSMARKFQDSSTNEILDYSPITGRVQKRRKEILRNEPECGISKQNSFSKRIIGGERAKFAELPWQVHIRISSYQCGGALLNHWYVATAAHCVHQAKLSKITVHLGEYDTKDTEKVEEPLDSESFKVERIILHPEFRYMLTQPDRYDIALLRLERPVYYRDNIIPICLPVMDYPLEGKIGVVAGWGKTDNSFGKTGTNLLNKVLVPILNNHQCRRWHKDKSIAVQLHEEMFCAGHKEGKRDACLGDSGGPLVINFDGQWTLVGITSAGFGCAVEKQPGIYHKVSKTARWIAKQIQRP